MKIKVSVKTRLLSLLVPLALLGMHANANAAEPLRMVVGSMSYPFEVFNEQGAITGGLLKEMNEKLAHELGTRAEFLRLPRRRIEPALSSGEVDLNCYSSPAWTDNSKALLWSIPTLKQIERVLVRKASPLPTRIPDDFIGKRVSVRLGYSYASIQPLFDAGKATRMDETQVNFMFKAVATGLTDMLISSDGEIEGYFQSNPQARKEFTAATTPFSVVATQCAISPKSRWSLAKIDKALGSMMKRGDFDRMTKHYGLSMH
jgi:polar amino acid transport system substrate-binding protein